MRWLGYDPAGRVLVGLVQVAFVLTAVGVVAAGLRYRRFRLLAGLAASTASPAPRSPASCSWQVISIRPHLAVTLDHGG